MDKRVGLYSIYNDDDLLFAGTGEECAKFLRIKIESFYQKVWRLKENKHKTKIKIYQIDPHD